MTLTRTLKVAAARFFVVAGYEHDPGFRDVIVRLCRRGMAVVGVLGTVCVVTLVGAYAAAGRSFAWSHADSGMVVWWDKLLVLVACVLILGLSRTETGSRWGRFVVAVMVVAVSVALLLDDVAGGNVSFTVAYIGLVMLATTSIIPYKPWQTFAFGIALSGAYLVYVESLPAGAGISGLESNAPRFVFLLIVALLCTGISILLYNSRYEQYKARRRAEHLREQVTGQAERLREMDRLKARFFANLSHEFRTPLTLILGPLETFLSRSESLAGAEARAQLETMHRHARRLLRLINQLLDLSKLEAGGMQLSARRGDIAEHLKGLVSAFASYAEHKEIDLQFQAEGDAIPLYFDADKVEKILFNLLSNAFKYTPAKGTIRVSVTETGREDAGTVEVSVKDTGTGIENEQLAFVFDRFHQVEDPAAGGRGGTGIGLALVKELVELHGGAVRAESAPGFGSEFTVVLPRGRAHLAPDQIEEGPLPVEEDAGQEHAPLYEPAPSEHAPAAAAAPDEAEREAAADTLLVVDDNADMRAYVRGCLDEYHVVEAVDGQEGLEKARDVVPDLIIADVMMPRLDGFAFCRQVKGDDLLSHIPVILLTARASDESKIEGLETGADDYLFKPFNAEELCVRVRNLIALRRRLRARFSQEVLIQPSGITVPSADEVFIDRARGVVEEHMADESFSVDAFAGALGLSARQLQRKLRALTGETPTAFVRLMRLRRAAQLLEQHAGTISEIAYEVGFNHPTYFATRFRDIFGRSPSEYAAEASEEA